MGKKSQIPQKYSFELNLRYFPFQELHRSLRLLCRNDWGDLWELNFQGLWQRNPQTEARHGKAL